MLDTNTASYVIRRRPLGVKQRFDAVGQANLAIALVLAELRDGAELYPTRSDDIHADIDDFCRRLAVVPWSETAAVHYGQIRATLRKAGTPIGNMDLLIAAHAQAEGALLVTNNQRGFRRVEGLTLEDWLDALDAPA